jgi:hypothetical protein
MHLSTYSSICTLAQLLQLLERARVPAVVHDGDYGDDLAFAEVADADGRVCAERYSKRPRVRGLELARGRSVGELGVPEDGRRSNKLAGNAQRRANVVGRRGCAGGGWLRRFGRREEMQRETEKEKEKEGPRSIRAAVARDRRGSCSAVVGGFDES